MGEPLPPERLAAIKARCEAATPGPWKWVDSSGGRTWRRTLDHVYLDDGATISSSPVLEIKLCGSVDAIQQVDGYIVADDESGEDDLAFIARTREDVPALLAEVERLQAELAALKSPSPDSD